MAARIDRLSQDDKRLLQTAAVIGTDVPLSLLQAVAEMPEETLHRGLVHLQAAEFLYETSLFPERVIYLQACPDPRGGLRQSAPGADDMLSHARIVEALELLSSNRLADQVERLAHHAMRGEVWDKALLYFRQAGDKALAHSAHQEAVAYFEQALDALSYLPETRDTRAQAIDLRLSLRVALRPFGDFERILAYLREAEAEAETIDDPRRLGQVAGALAIHFRAMGAHDQGIAAGKRALACATASGDVILYALANQHLGNVYEGQNDYRRAIDFFGKTVVSLEKAQPYERHGQISYPPCKPVPGSLRARPSWACSLRASTLGSRGYGLPRWLIIPQAS